VTTSDPPAEAPAAPEPPARRVPRWRRIVAMICIVVSCILVPLSIVAVWANNEVLDTDSYVETVAPLARNEEIVNAVSVRVTNTLFDEVDVETIAQDALPERAAFLAGPITGAVRDFVQDLILRFFETEAFQRIWDEANRIAHEQVDKALTGGGPVLSTGDGHVVLDLSPLVERVRTELSTRGINVFDRLPINQLALRFELFDAEGLESAQAGVRLLDRLAIILPIVTVLLAALGIWLAADRRKTLMRWGIGVAIATLVLGFALSIGRDFYLDALPEDANLSAAGAAFDIVLRFMRDSNRVLFTVGLLIALGAYLAGSSRLALVVRGKTTGAMDAVGDKAAAEGFDLGAVGSFVARHANGLRVIGVIAAFIVLILLDHPSAATVLVLLVLLLVYLAIVSIVARAGRHHAGAANVAQ
jgi:hypothetical protein